MARPGTEISIIDVPLVSTAPTETGTFFLAGTAERGDVKPASVMSLSQFTEIFGERLTSSFLYDSLDAFFREGGTKAYVARVVGPSAEAATYSYTDGFSVTALSFGAWGNSLDVQVVAGPLIRILDASGTLEESAIITSIQDAIDFGETSEYVRIAGVGAANKIPDPGTKNDLAGGTDDAANITDTEWSTAINSFLPDLGPGQIAIPGETDSDRQVALMDHAFQNNRIALVDLADGNATALNTAAVSLRGQSGQRVSAAFAPWIRNPGVDEGTTKLIPPSAIVAGLIARSDALHHPNIAAAGDNGITSVAVDLTQESFTELERQNLLNNGVNLFRNIYGQIRLYGYRTLTSGVSDKNWVQLTNSRTIMSIKAQANRIAEKYVFQQIDGRGSLISSFAGELTGMLMSFWRDGALYGDTPEEAFIIDVSQAVNPPENLADGILAADIALRLSPFAELVKINIVKTPITQNLS